LQKLIHEGRIAQPARTIRFVWPPEIEGTMALLNARPDIAARIKAAIHMDMVGGGPETKAVFHVTRGPMSLPSFVHDVAEAFAEFVNQQSYEFAATGRAKYPLVAPEGGKEALQAMMTEFTMGSDHEVYADSSWKIPAIYLNDWPDRYIHTNFDTPANIDPTKLKRAAFIGAASGYFLGQPLLGKEPELVRLIVQRRIASAHTIFQRAIDLGPGHDAAYLALVIRRDREETIESIRNLMPTPKFAIEELKEFATAWDTRLWWSGELQAASGGGLLVFQRNPEPKGPMGVFGYDYFEDKYGEERAKKLKLLQYEGLRGSGGEYAYEVLNFADGKRNAQQIRDAVSAEYGPVPLEYVVEYLKALEEIGVVKRVKP